MNDLPWFQSLAWRGFFVYFATFLAATIPTWVVVRTVALSADPAREADRALGLMTVAGLLAGAATMIVAARYLRRRLVAAERVLSGAVAGDAAAAASPDEISELAARVGSSVGGLREQMVKLQQEKGRLSTLLNGMGEAVLVLDENERLLLANTVAEKLLNLPADPIGRRIGEITRVPRVAAVASEVLWSREAATEDLDFSRHDEVRHLSVSASPIISVGDRVVGAVLLLYDVTRLRRLERVRRDFVANVSHELRTPIAAIQSTAETMLLADLPLDDVMLDFLRTIERNAERMGHIVSDLLTLSRLEAAGDAFELHEVQLAPIFAELYDHCHPIGREQGVQLVVDVDDDLPNVLGERTAIRQALENLVENGIKYTPHGGTVTLRAQAKNRKRLRIDVEDTGFGIPHEHLPRIFERFYRVDVGRSRDVGGTGLGLAIVKHLVRQMLGRITVESEVGEGTVFKVWLRIYDPERAR